MMARPVKWRYAVIGAGFLGLAGVRAIQGAPVWAAVFLVAAAVNAWLAVHEAHGAHGAPSASPAASAGGDGAVRVDPSEVDRSLDGHRASVRQWHILGLACLLVGGGLLFLEPPLAVFAGTASLFALYRAHRAGRAVATLQRARLVGGVAKPG
ncbi:MAG: hypothetical protein ACRDP3_02925 [Streptomyces sp.]|uniref:hypothetical protein n=1 Tax=Streptomyces sp. TaxID=1931 RepID=UPI003D6A37E8